jgi:hypothetical protein
MKNRLVFAFATAALAFVLIPLIAPPALGKDVGPPEVAWKDMTFKQKRAYMKSAVTPTMKPIFQAFDGKKFETFNCETCHGKGAADRKFKMPSPDIHALPNTPAAFEAKLKSEPTWPKWTKFMAEEVEPPMAKMMGMPVFNPKAPVEGAFGCAKCHRLEGPKP